MTANRDQLWYDGCLYDYDDVVIIVFRVVADREDSVRGGATLEARVVA
jgi:hypothetical protein